MVRLLQEESASGEIGGDVEDAGWGTAAQPSPPGPGSSPTVEPCWEVLCAQIRTWTCSVLGMTQPLSLCELGQGTLFFFHKLGIKRTKRTSHHGQDAEPEKGV